MNLLLVGTAVALVVAVAVVLLARPVRGPVDPVATLRAARRHEDLTALVSVLGLLAAPALLVAGATTSLVHVGGAPGLVSALSLTVGALIFLAVHYVGERTWPRPEGHVRQASLRRRTVTELAGRRGTILLVTSAVTAGCLVIFGLTASADGRSVPKLITPESAAEGFVGGASGPYPGWPYGVPLLVSFAVVLLASWAVLRLVARRPAVAGTTDADDHALRRTSARRILGGVQLFLGGTAAAVLLVSTVSLRSSGWGLAAVVTLTLALVLAVGSLVAAATAVPPLTAAATTPAGSRAPR